MIWQSRASAFLLAAFAILTVPDPAQASWGSCTLDGKTISSGTSIVAYSQKSVPFGQTCVSESRTCKFGRLSGSSSYAYSSCSVLPPASCSFNGQTVPSGGTVWAYTQSSVPANGAMNGIMCINYRQQRSCYNGVLSGYAQYASCVIDAPRACTFDGNTYASGTSITGYLAAAPNYTAGQSCQGENMFCSDGSWTYGDPQFGGFTPTSSTCTPTVPVVATVTPASQYQCTVRTTYSSTQIYDAMFALQPDTDIDCVNASNFYIVRSGQSFAPRQALWNYSSVVNDYSFGTATVFPSKCAYKLDANSDVTFSDDRIDMDTCRSFCVGASLDNPASSVMCYFAHTPVEGFMNGVGSIGNSAEWIPLPPTYYNGGG